MKKRLFQVLDEMNVSDTENGTKTVKISNYFISANMVKQGGKIEMGVDSETFQQIANGVFGNPEVIVVLLAIDRKSYKEKGGS